MADSSVTVLEMRGGREEEEEDGSEDVGPMFLHYSCQYQDI